METTMLLSSENLVVIKETIQTELLKRGVTAPIVKMEETVSRSGSHRLEFQTAEFQTIPVMFKKLQVNNFSSSVKVTPKSELNPGLEGEYISIWISVHFSYESFSGGTNGTSIFDIWFNVFGSTEYDTKLAHIR